MNDFSGKTLLMMAGGTGGHVYPALAVAKAAAAQGATIHWLGNPERFEGKAVPEAGFPLHDIHVRGLRGNGIVGWLKAPWMLLRAIFSRPSGDCPDSPGCGDRNGWICRRAWRSRGLDQSYSAIDSRTECSDGDDQSLAE